MSINSSSIRSICLLRLSAIGDVTHVLPVIKTLQANLVDVKITWVIGTLEYKLLKDLEGIEFVLFDKKQGISAYTKLRRDLSSTHFDVLMHMQYSFRSNLAAQMIKAKYRIGFDKKRSKEFHGFRLTHRISEVHQQHVLDSFMEFVKVLGITNFIYNWDIPTSANDEDFAAKNIKSGVINVIISPCSSNKYRNWSHQRYAIICDYLIEKYQANVLLCGGRSDFEQQTSAEIEGLCHYKINNITGKDTLKQLYAMMKRVDLVISPDSGPAHIANAANTPVIVLHAATTHKRSGAYRFPELAVDYFQQAADQIAKKPVDSIRWGSQITLPGVMDLIPVDDVKQKIDRVLSCK
jgi:heptosyltransferase I